MARTIRREEVAFPSAPDPRFGGNLARATEGAQYSRAFPGGPPGVDRRYENYQAPHRVDYTSPPYGGPGEPSQGYWQQMRQHPNQGIPRQHPNPRMRGMMGGIGGLQEKAAVDPSDWRTIIKILESGGNPGTETQVAYNPGMGGTYDDPYEGLDIIDMELLPGLGYEPGDEYEFDKKRGYDYSIWDNPPKYSASGGLMSLRR